MQKFLLTSITADLNKNSPAGLAGLFFIDAIIHAELNTTSSATFINRHREAWIQPPF
jgi:hypothetical protein